MAASTARSRSSSQPVSSTVCTASPMVTVSVAAMT